MHRFTRSLIIALLALGMCQWMPNRVSAASQVPELVHLFGSGSRTSGKNISLRVKLSTVAPAGGIDVKLRSSLDAVNVPRKIHVPGGAREVVVTVTTDAVVERWNVGIYATLGNVTKIHVVHLKTAKLTSIGLQRVIRHGGQGKLIVRLSGPAPSGGKSFGIYADPPGHLILEGFNVVVPTGAQTISLAIPALLGDVATGPGGRMPDLLVTVTVGDQFGDMTKSTIIRDFGDDPRPNELATVAPTATHIAENAPGQASTNTVIPPATMTAEATPASLIIDTKTAVATDEPTATSTMFVEPTQTAVDPAIDVPSPTPAPVSTGLPLTDPTVMLVGSALAGGDGT